MESTSPLRPAVRRAPTRLFPALIPVSLLIFVGAAADIARADRWIAECVDCPKPLTGEADRILCLDAAEHPHTAYGGDYAHILYRDETDGVKYAYRNASGWHKQPVWSAPEFLDGWDYYVWFIDYLLLVVTPEGTPYLAFCDPYTRDLKLASLLDLDFD